KRSGQGGGQGPTPFNTRERSGGGGDRRRSGARLAGRRTPRHSRGASGVKAAGIAAVTERAWRGAGVPAIQETRAEWRRPGSPPSRSELGGVQGSPPFKRRERSGGGRDCRRHGASLAGGRGPRQSRDAR